MGAAEFIDGQVKIWLAPWTYSWCLKCGSREGSSLVELTPEAVDDDAASGQMLSELS